MTQPRLRVLHRNVTRAYFVSCAGCSERLFPGQKLNIVEHPDTEEQMVLCEWCLKNALYPEPEVI